MICCSKLTIFIFALVAFALEINDTSLSILQRSSYSFIYFYSDTCKYCASFNPTFENLNLLFNNDGNFQILKSNARENKRLSQLFNVKHYPSLKLLNYDTKEIIEYTKDRDLKQIIDFFNDNLNVNQNYNNVESKLRKYHNLTDLHGNDDILVIFTMTYFHEWRDFNYPAHFIQKIANNSPINIYVIDIDQLKDNEILKKYKISNFPSMMYFRNGKFQSLNTNSQNYLTNKELSEENVRNFIDNIENGQWVSEVTEVDDFKIQMKPGMNRKQSDHIVIDDDDELESSLEHIEL